MAWVGKTFHVSCWLMKYCALLWEIRLFVSLSIFWEFSGEMNVFLSNCRLPPVKHTLPILFITRHSLKNANESLGNKWIWTFHNLDSALCSFPTAFLAPDSNGWFFFLFLFFLSCSVHTSFQPTSPLSFFTFQLFFNAYLKTINYSSLHCPLTAGLYIPIFLFLLSKFHLPQYLGSLPVYL